MHHVVRRFRAGPLTTTALTAAINNSSSTRSPAISAFSADGVSTLTVIERERLACLCSSSERGGPGTPLKEAQARRLVVHPALEATWLAYGR